MKKLFLILFCVMLCTRAEAEEALSFSQMQAAVEASGEELDLKEVFLSLVAGEMPADAGEILENIKIRFLREALKTSLLFTRVSLYVFLSALAKKFMIGGKSEKTAVLTIHLCVFLELFHLAGGVISHALSAARSVAVLSDALTPVLSSLLALTGGTRSAALITPMGALASGLMSDVLIKAGGTLIGILSVLTLSDAIGGIKLARLNALTASLFKWLTGVCLGVFLGLMTTGGLIAGAYDGTFVKGAKYLAGSLIPIVGSEIAGRMESIVSGAQLIRSAAGITGLAALMLICAGPALTVFACAWGFRLLAAMTECVADGETVSLLEGISKIFMCVLTLLCAAAAMIVILIGVTIGMGSRISG